MPVWAIGVLTVYGQGWLPGQWSTLANSGAVWLVFAFAAGSCMRSDGAAAAAGAGVLVCAVVEPDPRRIGTISSN